MATENPIPRRLQVDYLQVRLRRMVKSVIEKKSSFTLSSALKSWKEKHHHLYLKVLWIALITMFLAIFGYQVRDRIKYYMAYPVATDVIISKKTHQILPDVTICYQETEGTVILLDRWPKAACANAMTSLMQIYEYVSVDELWQKINTTTAVVSAKQIADETTDLQLSSIPLLVGTCTTFKSDAQQAVPIGTSRWEIVFKTYSHRCNRSSVTQVYIHERDDNPLTRKGYDQNVGASYKIGVAIKQYKFVQRPGYPCLSNKEHATCRKNCFLKYVLQMGNCSFPFAAGDSRVPPCSMSRYTDLLWQNIWKYAFGAILDKSCNCDRKCSHIVFETREHLLENNVNLTSYSFYIDNPFEILIKERLIYDVGNLLSDIGGNSGLYIGLSILSIFEYFQIFAKLRKKRSKFSTNDPLYCKVLKTSKLIFTDKYHMLKKTDPPISILTYLLIAVCTSMFTFGIVMRVTYYFQHPVRRFVSVSFNSTLEQPVLTVCYGSNSLKEHQKIVAKLKNITNYCDVNMWDLLDYGLSAEDIWINAFELYVWVWNYDPQTPETLPEGTCAIFREDDRIVPAQKLAWVISNYEKITHCGTNTLKVYFKLPTGFYDFNMYRYVMLKTIHQISYTVQEIKLDPRLLPCVSEMENALCKHSCLKMELLLRIKCRLPYMPDMSLRMCRRSTEAKNSHFKYLELFSLQESAKDCGCLPPCTKRFYLTYVTAQPYPRMAFSFGAVHNVIETYHTDPSYSLISLLCDIGGWLGSTLGLCLFSTFEFVLSRFSKFLRVEGLQ